jgi:glucose 1-dehydrogenase
MFEATVARFGTVHILVNNAGIQDGAKFQDMTLAQWRKVIDVNLTGMFLCSRAAVREFLRRGLEPEISSAAGKIICMSSVHQVIPWAFEANYAASKGGVNLLMQSLAQEFAVHKIRVNAVAPGAIRTGIDREVWETESALKKLLDLVPYGHIGEPSDIGQAVLWLASDLSDYMNGATSSSMAESPYTLRSQGRDEQTYRGLRLHRQHAERRSHLAGRFHRLALPAAIRLRRLLRCPARNAGS